MAARADVGHRSARARSSIATSPLDPGRHPRATPSAPVERRPRRPPTSGSRCSATARRRRSPSNPNVTGTPAVRLRRRQRRRRSAGRLGRGRRRRSCDDRAGRHRSRSRSARVDRHDLDVDVAAGAADGRPAGRRPTTVHVTITIKPETGTKTFERRRSCSTGAQPRPQLRRLGRAGPRHGRRARWPTSTASTPPRSPSASTWPGSERRASTSVAADARTSRPACGCSTVEPVR